MRQATTIPATTILESDLWRISLQPEMGLQTQFCKVQHRGQWVDILFDCSQADCPISASNFHMLPYSNRIRNANFSYEGQEYSLSDAQTHAIHGALRKLHWRVTEQSTQSITAAYDSRTDGAINWPWPIAAQTTYTILDNTLTSRMTLTNHGTTRMPAGMGWHPYFSRTVAGANPVLTLPVQGMFLDTNGDCLPVGEPVALPSELDFTKAKAVDPDQRIDHCFSGFKAPATLAWPDAGIALRLHASDNCSHLVLFNPEQPYLAIEPVTNANDGFNLNEKGIDAGVIDIEPGDTVQCEFSLELVTD